MAVFTTETPYKRVTFRGHQFNERTVCMLRTAESDWGGTVSIVQGSYRGDVGASAGTHDGGGAIDISVSGLSTTSRNNLVLALRKCGWAAWYRTPSEGPWIAHIHGIAMWDAEASPSAKNQMTAYVNGRNGLANNGPDTGPRVDPQFYSTEFLSRYVTSDDLDFTPEELAEAFMKKAFELPNGSNTTVRACLADIRKFVWNAAQIRDEDKTRDQQISAKVDEISQAVDNL